MAYSIPPRWDHGLINATAARMNVYSDDLNDLNTALGGLQLPCHKRNSADDGGAREDAFAIVHTYRWLWYMTTVDYVGGSAYIKDISGINPDVTLTENEGSMIAYDLSNVQWLTPGIVYQIWGCDYVAEDYES